MSHAIPMTVLVVDDEILIRLELAHTLAERGLNVTEAATADQALEMLNRGLHFDVLLTDVDMPGKLDGKDLARIVAMRYPQVCVIVCSGRIDVVGGLPFGVSFLPKPYDAGILNGLLSPHVAMVA